MPSNVLAGIAQPLVAGLVAYGLGAHWFTFDQLSALANTLTNGAAATAGLAAVLMSALTTVVKK